MNSDDPDRYTPAPIPLEDTELPESLGELVEALAQSAHDVWALQRMAEGWKWGACRDDAKKEHPCLVQFDALPENEKEYDRLLVSATLRSIIALGFRVTKRA